MNLPLFITACMMVYFPTLVIAAACERYKHNMSPLLRVSTIVRSALVSVALTIISLGLVLAFKSFV